MIGDLARSKGLAFAVNATDLPQGLMGDPVRLRQALLNYLANAIEVHGRRRHHLAWWQAGTVGPGNACCASRCPTRHRHRARPPGTIFDAFEQGLTTRAPMAAPGWFAITRRIAQLMGGDTGVASAPGLGSSFWLTVGWT